MGCKSLSVQNKQYQTTTKQVVLGGVGIDETYDFERTYSYSGIPNYSAPVKVQMTPLAFSKGTYKPYTKASTLQPTEIKVNYVDSLPEKPKFLNIEIADKIGLINLLNDSSNQHIKKYLLNQNDSHVVTNVSVVFDENTMESLMNADEVFVEQIGVKAVGLKLYTDGRVTSTLNFNDGVVFAYRVASICWQENSKHQLDIVDLVEGDNGCPSQTYSSAKRAKKEVDYFKFERWKNY